MNKRIYSIIFLLLFELIFAQQGYFPIIAVQGVPASNTDYNNFLVLKEAGFTINLNIYENTNQVKAAAKLGEKSKIKIIAWLPNLSSNPEAVANELKDETYFLGYYIEDEPSTLRFKELSNIVNRIRAIDKKHITYINLLPNYASNTNYVAKNYDEYVKQFITIVNPKLISFDNYPIVNNTVRKDFYENLEIIRSNSYKYNIPFWAYACTAIHYDYKAPTLPSIKLQQFSNLLYGAQAIQYYTYWTVDNQYWKENNYSYAIVDNQGNPTLTYKIVKAVNQQIQRLSWIFLGAKADAVFHTGNDIPQGTVKLNSLPKRFSFFSTYGKNALISLMTNGKRKFIIVQNTSLNDDLQLEYRLARPTKVVNNNTGKAENILTSKNYNSKILPGDILIFTYDI